MHGMKTSPRLCGWLCAAALSLTSCGGDTGSKPDAGPLAVPPAQPQSAPPAVPAAQAPKVLDGTETEWYPGPAQTQKKSEGQRKAGKRVGTWTWWDAAGNVSVVGQFEDDKETGTWIESYPSGKKKKEDQWQSGTLRESVLYAENGAKVEEKHYAGGRLDGLFTHYHANGQKAAEGLYKAGLKQGEWKEWHPNGMLAKQGVMLDDRNDGPWSSWYENGQLSQTVVFQQGAMNGELQAFYRDGKPRMTGSYSAGKKTGEWRCYTPAGVLDEAASGIFVDNQRAEPLPAPAPGGAK